MEESQELSSAEKVKEVKKPWKEVLKQLTTPFDYESIRDELTSSKFWFTLPNEVLTFEGYVKILAYLQNLRNDIVRIKLTVDEHAGMKNAALKNMKEILPGVFDDCKTDKLREAKAAGELEQFTIFVKQADELQKFASSVLENIDSAIAQVNRQLKAVDMGIRTSSIITSEANDWQNRTEEDYDDELEMHKYNKSLDEE